MMAFYWKLHDAGGDDMRSTQAFESRDEAEEWMGEQWAALAGEGAESVSLLSDGEELYRMSLAAE